MDNNIVKLTENGIKRLHILAVESPKSDVQKAKDINEFCDYNTFIKEYNILVKQNKIDSRVMSLKKIYDEYHKINLFKLGRVSRYLTDFDIYYEKILDYLLKIVNDDSKSELYKAYEAYSYFCSGNKLKNFMYKNGTMNFRDRCKDKIKTMYEVMNEWDQKGLNTEIKFYINNSTMYDTNKYAEFIIKEFNNTNIENINQFLYLYGINKEIFDYCLNTVKETNVDLYSKYVTKYQQYIEYSLKYFDLLMKQIKLKCVDIALLAKYIPFQHDPSFKLSCFRLLEKYKPEYLVTFKKFLFDYKISDLSFKKIDYTNILNTKVIINDIELNKDDNNNIINYINNIGLEPNNITYKVYRDKYIKGQLNNDLFSSKEQYTIIPKA